MDTVHVFLFSLFFNVYIIINGVFTALCDFSYINRCKSMRLEDDFKKIVRDVDVNQQF